MKKHQIWLGWYNQGTGHIPPIKPELLAEIEAISFRVACYIYELESALQSIKRRMALGRDNVEDGHFGRMYYSPESNSNSWTGKYYESEYEAWKSFPPTKETVDRTIMVWPCDVILTGKNSEA